MQRLVDDLVRQLGPVKSESRLFEPGVRGFDLRGSEDGWRDSVRAFLAMCSAGQR